MQRSPSKSILGAPGNALVLLMAVLAIVFCVFKFIQLTFVLSHSDFQAATAVYREKIYQWVTLPASLNSLASRPWTLLTYAFVHDGVFHLIGNLIWLWVFGFILQDLTGNKTIIPLFVYGALFGALLYLACFNVLPGLKGMTAGSFIEGGSAGVMSIALATTMLAPGFRFFPMINGGIPLWVVTVLYVIVDFAMIAGMSNVGGHIAHIGGALMGIVYMSQLQRGNDWGSGLNRMLHALGNLFTPAPRAQHSGSRGSHFYETRGNTPYKKIPNLTQRRIDAILDKIGKEGMHQLTEEEKQILKRAAEDDSL